MLLYLPSCVEARRGSDLESSKFGEPPLRALPSCGRSLCAHSATQSPQAAMLTCCQPRRTIRQEGSRRVRLATSVEIASYTERLVARSMLGEVLRIGIGARGSRARAINRLRPRLRQGSAGWPPFPNPSRRACWGDHFGRSPRDALAGLNRPALSPCRLVLSPCRRRQSLPPRQRQRFLLRAAGQRLPRSRCQLLETIRTSKIKRHRHGWPRAGAPPMLSVACAKTAAWQQRAR